MIHALRMSFWLAQGLFILLKLVGVIGWPWWVVMLPTIAGMICGLAGAILVAIGEHIEAKRPKTPEERVSEACRKLSKYYGSRS